MKISHLALLFCTLPAVALAGGDKVEDAKATIKQDAREVGQTIARDSKQVGHAVARDSKAVGHAVAEKSKEDDPRKSKDDELKQAAAEAPPNAASTRVE